MTEDELRKTAESVIQQHAASMAFFDVPYRDNDSTLVARAYLDLLDEVVALRARLASPYRSKTISHTTTEVMPGGSRLTTIHLTPEAQRGLNVHVPKDEDES